MLLVFGGGVEEGEVGVFGVGEVGVLEVLDVFGVAEGEGDVGGAFFQGDGFAVVFGRRMMFPKWMERKRMPFSWRLRM